MLLSSNTDPNALHTTDKTLKYAIKRDLSGDVQFTNCSTVGKLTTGGPTDNTTKTTSKNTNQGWNFFKIPKLFLRVFDAPGGFTLRAKFKVNGIQKFSAVLAKYTGGTFSTTKTPATPSIVSSMESPNKLTLVGSIVNSAYSWGVSMKSSAQRNDKISIMKF